MIDDDFEFVAIFRDEANERLDDMVATLLELESGRSRPDAVDALFRDAHTIKGGAAMVGLDTVAEVAHRVEDVLHDAREGGSLDSDLVEPLLHAADAMRRLVAGEGEAGDASALAGIGGDAGDGEAVAVEPAPSAPAERRSIRVAPEKVDRLLDLVGESLLHRRRLEHVMGAGERELADELDLGERLLDELKETAVGMRTVPLASVTSALPRAVRDAAQSTEKEVELTFSGIDTELDRVILESLSEPLVHLLRNAVAHGIEPPGERERAGKPRTGRVELRAEQRGGFVEVVVADDGRGVPATVREEARTTGSTITDVLTRAGFSTAAEVTDLAGRGVGLDAVKRHVESFGGTLEVRSESGAGTEIVLVLPLSLALLDVLLVERGENVYGIPLAQVDEAIAVDRPLVLGGRTKVEHRGGAIALADVADVLRADAPALADRPRAVVVQAGGKRVAIACDALLGEEEVVVKPLGPLLAGLSGYLGAAILGDGRIALLLEPASLMRPAAATRRRPATAPVVARTAPKVLVVEDSLTVRELQRSILEAAGYRVVVARNGREGLDALLADDDVQLVLTDVEMPELDGIGLTEAIRASDRASTPIVILTSLDDEDARRRGLEAGADAYMVKSGFGQQALLATVERLVGA